MDGAPHRAITACCRYPWPTKVDWEGMVMIFSSIKIAIIRFSVDIGTFLTEPSATHKSEYSAPLKMIKTSFSFLRMAEVIVKVARREVLTRYKKQSPDMGK